MSRSNPTTESLSPVKRHITFSGETGVFSYWDKEKLNDNNEKGVRAEMLLPLSFLVLDQLATITGWHEPTKSQAYSNEVHNITKEEFVVSAYKGVKPIAKGFYKDIKIELKADDLKFTQSIYAIVKIGDEYQLVNIKFKGAALSAWLDLTKEKDVYKGAISIKGTKDSKKGSIEYKTPVFTHLKDVSEEAERIATGFDEELQEYLKSKNTARVDEAVVDEAVNSEENDLPF